MESNNAESAGSAAVAPSSTLFTITQQNNTENARVHNGDTYIYQRAIHDDEDRLKILGWLSPLQSDSAHQEVRKAALIQDQIEQHNTHSPGKWLLESSSFEKWRSGEIRKLWYFGMPGAGKTVLASIIIEHLQRFCQSAKDEHRPYIAFLYLSYKENHAIEALVGSVIKQLVENIHPLPEAVRELWNPQRSHPSLFELTSLLLAISEDHRTYIVIDALDECPRETRLQLLKALRINAPAISTLITSRLIDEFEDLAMDFQKDNIKANSKDLDLFLEHQFNSDPRMKRLLKQDPNLRATAKINISKRCNGMFLLASLHAKSLASALRLADFRARLLLLPGNIEDQYHETMNRIEQDEPAMRVLAHSTLAWIVLSGKPLRIEELQHALAIVPGNYDFDPEMVYDGDTIRGSCRGLVEVMEGVVSLVHYTAQSFFNDRQNSYFPGYHTHIAQACVTYLSLYQLQQPDAAELQLLDASSVDLKPETRQPKGSHLSYAMKCDKYPFARYSALYLGHHLRQIPIGSISEVLPILSAFLKDKPKRNFFIRVVNENIIMDKPHGYHDKTRYDKIISAGLSKEFKHSRHFRTVYDHNESTYSRFRSARNDFEIGARVSVLMPTSLHVAAYLGWVPIVQNIAEDTSSQSIPHLSDLDETQTSPLEIAVMEGHLDVAAILLEHGASADFKILAGHTLLLHISHTTEGPGEDLIEKLITKALDPLPSYRGGKFGTFRIVASLIASLIMSIWYFTIPFSISHFPYIPAMAGHKQENEQGKSYAEGIEEDSDEKGSFNNYLQLLLYAKSGDIESIRNLNQQGLVRCERWDAMFQNTALFLAIEFGRIPVAKEFLERGADVNMRGLRGTTPLHCATAKGHVEMVRVLLEHSPDLELLDGNSHTPWEVALDLRNTQIIALLRRAGAKTDKADHDGVTHIYKAAAGGHVESVRFFLECGVNPSQKTRYDWAPLHWAAHNGRMECVRILLEANAEINPVSDQKQTPLDSARNGQQPLIEQILLEAGALTATEVLDTDISHRQR